MTLYVKDDFNIVGAECYKCDRESNPGLGALHTYMHSLLSDALTNYAI